MSAPWSDLEVAEYSCGWVLLRATELWVASLLGEAGRAGSEGPVFSVSHLYGFGLVDAEALVLEARKWTAVPAQHVCVATADKRPR